MGKPKKDMQLLEGFAKRLNEALDELGYLHHGRQTALAKVMGVSQRATMAWLKGISIPDYPKIVSLSKRLGLSLEWLLSGQGSMRDTPRQVVPVVPWDQVRLWLNPATRNQIEDVKHESPPSLMGPDGFATTMFGPSMEPDIMGGDLIFVDPDRVEPDGKFKNDEILLVVQDNDQRVRKIIYDGGKGYLVPSNPLMKEVSLKYLDDKTKVLGVVIGKSRVF